MYDKKSKPHWDFLLSLSSYMNNTLTILPNENFDIPLILCGDLNISKPSKLKQMLKNLNFVNGPLIGKIQYSSLGDNHELFDYILVKTKIFKFSKKPTKFNCKY